MKDRTLDYVIPDENEMMDFIFVIQALVEFFRCYNKIPDLSPLTKLATVKVILF
jgi:hypothetical protein